MLAQISINNIAVVKHADIEFYDGLNVITGETGAGKSVIIGAIQMILGEKITKNIIRTGEEKADVSAIFYPDEDAWESLEELGIEKTEDETLLIFREISLNGRSVCKINGTLCQISLLKEVANLLVNIHGQQDTALLYSEAKQLELLDGRADEVSPIMQQYTQLYLELKETDKMIDELSETEENRKYQTELLEFQINEIEMLGLKENETEELEERINELKNSEVISKSLKETYKLISAGDYNAGDLLRSASGQLQYLKSLSARFEGLSEQLDDVTYRLEDIAALVSSQMYETEANPAELEELSDRLYTIKTMCNKYKLKPAELILFPENARKKLEELTCDTEKLEKLKIKKNDLIRELTKKAEEISGVRKKTAKLFEKDIISELVDLNMPKVQFEVSFEKLNHFSVTGMDKVEFLISPNAGESLKPMAKVASGGEMSRIMLGVKSFTSAFEKKKTYIFDEIDTGISGVTAQKVAEKLKKVSEKDQTIVITHSAHIAVKADSHYLIRKRMTESETKTEVTLLDRQGRISEIARINAGAEPTATALAQAEEMLVQNE